MYETSNYPVVIYLGLKSTWGITLALPLTDRRFLLHVLICHQLSLLSWFSAVRRYCSLYT